MNRVEIQPLPSRIQQWLAAGVLLFAFAAGCFADWPARLLLWGTALAWWLWQWRLPPAIRIEDRQLYCWQGRQWRAIAATAHTGVMYVAVRPHGRLFWRRYWRDSMSERQWRLLSIWAAHGTLAP